jgi:hypothetical protein
MAITSVKTGSSFTNLQKYDNFLGPNSAFNPSSYESIATVTVGAGGTSTVSFTSIPSTYQHLQIRAFSLNDSGNDYLCVKFNSDTTSTNYRQHYILGDGSSTGAGSTQSGVNGVRTYTTYGPNNYFTAGVIDIVDYANTNKYKTVKSLSGFDTNNTDGGIVWFTSSLWMSSTAINRIDLFSQAANFKQYSSFALYGIRG